MSKSSSARGLRRASPRGHTLPTVAISLGCPSGIGPEIVADALGRRAVRRRLVPVVFGDLPTFLRFPSLRRLVPVSTDTVRRGVAARVAVTDLAARDRRPGRPTRASGRAQLSYFDAAVDAALAGAVDALCTAPVSKEQIARSGVPFTGHTERLAERFGVPVLMLMDGPRLKVALATQHVPLARVPALLKTAGLVAQLVLLDKSLRPRLGRRPRIAVCGVNPHAGDGGLLGEEELRVIAPAVQDARRRGILCNGPVAADGLFAQLGAGTGRMSCDAVLAMYHDQGLVAAKAVDFAHTVNVTLGLPIPRTSPDHGTAYDIAGKARASAEPMVQALLRAAELA